MTARNRSDRAELCPRPLTKSQRNAHDSSLAERPLSKAAKAQALVDEGLADDLAEARAFLADMGE